MPWWAILYLMVFVALNIVADTLGESDGKSRFAWFVDLLAGAAVAILFAGFWLPSIYHALGFAAPTLFVGAVVWELYSTPSDFREVWQDEELSRAERIGLLIGSPLLIWPAFVVAGVGLFSCHEAA